MLQVLGPGIKRRDRGAVGAGAIKPLPPCPSTDAGRDQGSCDRPLGLGRVLTTECFLWSCSEEVSDSTRELSWFWFCLSAWGSDNAEPAKGPLR